MLEHARQGIAVAGAVGADVGSVTDGGHTAVAVVDEGVGAVDRGTLGQVVVQAERELLGIAASGGVAVRVDVGSLTHELSERSRCAQHVVVDGGIAAGAAGEDRIDREIGFVPNGWANGLWFLEI